MIKVLMYHRIVDDATAVNSDRTYSVHIRSFVNQLELLERWGFTPITFHDYRLCAAGELTLPKKAVILTFDDGYADTYTLAFPALQRFGMKGVVFVLGNRTIRANFWDQERGMTAAPLMEDEHILELHAAGHEIGSHSMTHKALTMIPREHAMEEVSRSRIVLEILLNSQVRTFAYPYGIESSSVQSIVEEAGYHAACGTYSGPGNFGSNFFNIRRILVPGTIGPMGFASRLLTPFELYEAFRWRTRVAIKGLPVHHRDFAEPGEVRHPSDQKTQQ